MKYPIPNICSYKMSNVAVKIEVSSLHFPASQSKTITLQQCLTNYFPHLYVKCSVFQIMIYKLLHAHQLLSYNSSLEYPPLNTPSNHEAISSFCHYITKCAVVTVVRSTITMEKLMSAQQYLLLCICFMLEFNDSKLQCPTCSAVFMH